MVVAIATVAAAVIGAILVQDGAERANEPTRHTAVAPVHRQTTLFVQLLSGIEPLAVADPATGRLRVLKLPTMKGDFLDRLTRSDGRLVWMAPGGTFSIDESLKGNPRRLSPLPFLESATPGRLWFISHLRGANGLTRIIEKTVRGKVTGTRSWLCADECDRRGG